MPKQVKWRRNRKAEFADWLSSELHNALSDRLGLERQWSRHVEQYYAPRRGPGEFPFPGASNEEMPLTAMHAEPIIAQFMQSIHATRNLWTAVDLSGEFTASVNAITEFVSVVDRLFLRMRDVNQRAFPDLVVLGTCAYQNAWRFDRRRVQAYDENGEVISETKIIDAPVVRHIPLPDFIWPANAWDLDPDAPVAPAQWKGHRFKVTENELRARSKGQEPFLPNYDPRATAFVLDRETEEEEIVEGKIRDMDNLRPSFNRKIELFRIEARFDTDDDGIDEDVIIIFHKPTATILQATHNPWHHGQGEYEVAQYIKMFSMLGVGIAQMTEYAQAAGSKLLNAQIDNALIANTRMYGFPQGMAISPTEPIYPGKAWPLGPDEKIQEIKMGDIYPSTFQILGELMQWQEQRTSVSELNQGNISGLPSRTPATTVLTLLQEGSKKFDMVQSNLRDGALGNIGKRTLMMIAQRHQAGSSKWAELARNMLGAEDAQKVIEVLTMPQAAIEEGLGIEVTATSGQVNREVQKQNLIGLAQFFAQAYPQLFQAAELMGDKQIMQNTAMSSYNGGIQLLTRLLEAFDIQNPQEYLPNPIPQQQQGQGQQQNGGQGAQLQSQLGGPLGPGPFAQGGPQLGQILGLPR